MSLPRLFLVAPAGVPLDHVIACASAACKAADCASILVHETTNAATVAALQALSLAVIVQDCEPRHLHRVKADGLHLSRSAPVKNLRGVLQNESIGVFAATSRHIAMEAAESGADYVAFAQKSQQGGEPLLQWWQEIFEVPAVAWDPVAPEDLATLLPQKPDFIRPLDVMWESPEQASATLSTLSAKFR